MIRNLSAATFYALHGLIHTGYISPRPAPAPDAPPWPFELDRSWLLTPLGADATTTRVVGGGLLAIVLGAYASGALATLGVIPRRAVEPSIVAGSGASAALLGLYFHRYLTVGLVIDLALLWFALTARRTSRSALGRVPIPATKGVTP